MLLCFAKYIFCKILFEKLTKSHFVKGQYFNLYQNNFSNLNYFVVNDGLSTRPAYHGIVDAFKSIRNSGGIRALYQVWRWP